MQTVRLKSLSWIEWRGDELAEMTKNSMDRPSAERLIETHAINLTETNE